jgi:hypothetical protein
VQPARPRKRLAGPEEDEEEEEVPGTGTNPVTDADADADADPAPAPWNGPATTEGSRDTILNAVDFVKQFVKENKVATEEGPPPTREELLKRLKQKTVRHSQLPRRKKQGMKNDMKQYEHILFNECGGNVEIFCKKMGVPKEAIPAVVKMSEKFR